MNSHTKSMKHHLLTMAVTLSVISLGFVSIGQAQTAVLDGTLKSILYCDEGGGETEKFKGKVQASFFVNFSAFPTVSILLTLEEEPPALPLKGLALAKSSKKGVFGAVWSDTKVGTFAVNGTYKVKKSTGNVKEIKGRFQSIFDDDEDQCIWYGTFKAKD